MRISSIILLSFLLYSCESLSNLEKPGYEEQLSNTVILSVEDLLEVESLIGYFYYPGTSDTVMRIFPTIMLSEDLQNCVLHLSQPVNLGFPSVGGDFEDEIIAERVVVHGDAVDVYFLPENERPSLKIKEGRVPQTIDIEYNLSGIYNSLYGCIAKPFRSELVVVSVFEDFSQIRGKHFNLEPIEIVLREGVFYPNSYIQFEIHPNEEGTRAHAVMRVHIGEYSPESKIIFGYNELDYSFNEIRSFRSELDTTSPEVVIKIYPNLEQIMMYWQAGHPYEEMMFEIRLFPDWMLLKEWDSEYF